MGKYPAQAHPSPDYATAIQRFDILHARDDAAVRPDAGSALYTHGHRAERSIVFFHGLTSSPPQFHELGRRLFDRGYNVLIPRMPGHGLRDSLTHAHGSLTATRLAAAADEAVDIACGLGEQVAVAGLSMGGVLTGWVCQHRREVGSATIIAPAFGVLQDGKPLPMWMAHLTAWLPSWYHWWDGAQKTEAPRPEYEYPGFPTRVLANMLLLGLDVCRDARQSPPVVPHICLVTNANDDAVDNQTAKALYASWRGSGAQGLTEFEFPAELGLPHDVISPENEKQQIEKVYPLLIDLITRQAKA